MGNFLANPAFMSSSINGSLLVERARGFALRFHGDQKYGEHPYSVHLEAVAVLARPYGAWAEAVSWLHDVVEDTPATLVDIELEFSLYGRVLVALLTDEPGETRKIRKAATYKKLAKVEDTSFERLALVVKACDRLANVRSCLQTNSGLLQMYAKEQEVFRAACYRPGLCDPIWEELDQIFPVKI